MKQFETKEELVKEANEQLKGYVVYHEAYGDGEIVDLVGSSELLAHINFMGQVRYMSIKTASKRMTQDNNLLVLLDYVNAYQVFVDAEENARRELYWKQVNEEKERQRLADEEDKYQKKVANSLKELDKLTKSKSKQLNSIDWIRENVSAITARVPTYMVSWFQNQFGKDTKCEVVDPRKKTSGGYSAIFGLGLAIRFKTSDGMPAELKRLTLPSNDKVISNNQFVFDLLTNHDFKFGNKKDMDAMRANYSL